MTTGQRPAGGLGFALADTAWLRALSDGLNFTSNGGGVTAHSGGTQAAAFPLPNSTLAYEVDTVAADNDSVLLPLCQLGVMKIIFNNGAHTLAVYANTATNPLTGTTDVINKAANTSSYTLTTGQCALFFGTKNGVWAAIKTA